jgi:hypothetical protein
MKKVKMFFAVLFTVFVVLFAIIGMYIIEPIGFLLTALGKFLYGERKLAKYDLQEILINYGIKR